METYGHCDSAFERVRDAIAETFWHLAHQDRSAWTMELEVRPFKEKF